MSVGHIGNSNPLLTKLESNGLSADKAKIVRNDLADVLKDRSGTGKPNTVSVREALDKKIDADVAAGKLSTDDAAKIKKTLDDIDAQIGGTGDRAAAHTSSQTGADTPGAAVGGGGGGGGSNKTELSETVTVSGSIKTTTTTYTDGTASTTTTTASSQDQAKYGSRSGIADDAATAQYYLSTIGTGSLIDQTA